MSVGIGTALAGVAAAGVGAAASKGIGALLGTGPQQANLTSTITPEQLEQDRQNALLGVNASQQYAQGLQGAGAQGTQAQQGLLSALQQQAEGGGPNPAGQALANATGANVAQTAALEASSRGAGSNAGLVARNAALSGANIQQQAAGQMAQQRMQQQLNAQGLLAGQANQQVAQQGAAIGQQGQIAQGQQGLGLNAAGNLNAVRAGSQANVNQGNQAYVNQAIGGVQAAGTGALAAMTPSAPSAPAVPNVPLQTMAAEGGTPGTMMAAHGGKIPGQALEEGDSEENDVVPTLLSPGEIVIPRSYASDPKAAAAFAHAVALMGSKK